MTLSPRYASFYYSLTYVATATIIVIIRESKTTNESIELVFLWLISKKAVSRDVCQ